MKLPKPRQAGVATLLACSAAIVLASSAPAQERAELAERHFVIGCDVVLFASALGLRPSVLQWAEALRSAGHSVSTPDFLDGEIFSDYGEAARGLEARGGIAGYMEWTQEVGRTAPAKAVFMGFSNGAGAAELLAAQRPRSVGVVLMHGALAPEQLGIARWPSGVPVQVHFAEGDPFRNPEAVAALKASVEAAGAEFRSFSYPGTGHLFADADLPDFDQESRGLMAQRVFRFLGRLCTDG